LSGLSKQFVPVNFSTGQLLDEDTLNQMNNNAVYLRDQAVDGKYTADWGGVWDTNIKLMCGRIYIPQGSPRVVYGTVAFTSLFSPGAQPVITTSILAQGAKYEHSVYGIGQYFPDHRGFQFKIKIGKAYSNSTVFSEPVYLMWQAMGF